MSSRISILPFLVLFIIGLSAPAVAADKNASAPAKTQENKTATQPQIKKTTAQPHTKEEGFTEKNALHGRDYAHFSSGSWMKSPTEQELFRRLRFTHTRALRLRNVSYYKGEVI